MNKYKMILIGDNLRNENLDIIFTKYIIYLLKLIIIFLLIVIILCSILNYIYKNESYYKDPLANDHSLYNLFKYPQISILIIDIENWIISQKAFENMLNYFLHQKLEDIEILFHIEKFINKKYYNIITNYSLLDNRIKINYYNKNTYNTKFMDKISYLMNKSKGKFILLMNKIINFKENELEQYYNFTKGKPNNIFKFVSDKKNTVYLIKSKILKDIIDNEIKFDSLNSLINYIFLI